MISTETVNPFSRAWCCIQHPSSQSSITPRDWVYYSAQRGFRPEKPCQMESILILNANTADTLIAGALLTGETTQPSWWVENFRERSLNKQRLPVRMCHVRSQVHGWPFDLFTGNLFLQGWLRLGCKVHSAWSLEIWNWILPPKIKGSNKETKFGNIKQFLRCPMSLFLDFFILVCRFLSPFLSGYLRLTSTPQKYKPFDSDIIQGQSFIHNPYRFHAMLKPVFMV